MEKTKKTIKFNTPYDRKRCPGELPGTVRIVETTGYRSTKQQVAEYMAAGLQLQNYRKGMYDFESEDKVDEEYEDRTRSTGYDPADATQDLRNVEKRLRQQAAVAKEKQKRESLENDKPKAEPDTEPVKKEE